MASILCTEAVKGTNLNIIRVDEKKLLGGLFLYDGNAIKQMPKMHRKCTCLKTLHIFMFGNDSTSSGIKDLE